MASSGEATRRRPRRAGTTGQTGALLRDPNFRPYLIGNMLSNIGTWFQTLAQSVLVFDLTHSTFLVGVVSFAQYAPLFLLAPLVGRISDRHDRRTVLMQSQIGAIAVTGTLCLVTALGAATPGVVIGFAFLLGIAIAFSTPTGMALVPSLVHGGSLSAALALNSVSYNIARAVGPVLAAVVINTLGAAWAFGINSLSYVALVLALRTVRPLIAQLPPAVPPRLRDSVRLVLRDRTLAALLFTITAMNLTTDPPITLGPAFMTDVYHTDTARAGLLIGAFGAGAVTAAFTFAHRLRGSRRTIAATLATAGIGVVSFAVAPTLALGLACLFVMGIGYLSTNTGATSRLQRTVDASHRGRIMVLWSLAFLGARPVGGLVDGALASWAGVRVAAAAMGLPALIGAVLFASVGLRGRRQRPPRG
jgi:MFS family permease